MTRKTTKRALLTSVISMLICIVMLVGTTFAWFTDSVTSAGNIIKSGTLDVTMEWKDATKTGKQLTYKDASEGAIFNYDLWEPGYVEAKNIKISNAGTLALKYNLNIAANGEVSELADVIDVYFAEGEYTLASREMTELTLVGTLSDILEGMPANMAGDLEANTADTVTIALKMQESAGNEYQGLAIGSDFSVILMATQDNVEKDSFDENYDDIEVPDKDIKVIDGNTYHYYNNGTVALATVPYGNVGATFTVPNDVTVLGQGDVYAGAVPVFSKSSPIETITLNEGLVDIKARAISGVKTLTSINFPSTLKAIRAQALRQTGMSTLTIPASVEFIGAGAFRDMANLTTVTVEGNVEFEQFVFRSCPNLETIYLLGDDVTFASGQFATHADTGDATGITIYVKNATVAARLMAAQLTGGYEVKILGEAADGSDATDVEKVANDTQLDAAITDGASAVVLGSGEYTIPDSAQGKTLTIVGNGETTVSVVDDGAAEGDLDYSFDGSTVTFENVTLNIKGSDHPGYARMSAVYNNCTIVGSNYTLYGDSVFNNCTFNLNNGYVWTWGAPTVEFNGCTFEDTVGGKAKAILVHNTVETVVTVKDCTFKATASAATWDGIPVAAVSIDPENGSPDATVHFEGTNTYADAFYGLYQVKYADEVDDVTITVDGKEVTVTAMK